MFMTVGIIISIFGFISGIVTGSVTHNFLFCLWVWIGTFLYALIYFGFAAILQAIAEMKVQMNSRLDAIANAETETVSVIAPSANIPYNQNTNAVAQSAPAPSPAAPVTARNPEKPGNDWICPKCGSKNSRLVTKCMNCDALLVSDK